jgi:hypothetical protein
MKLHPKYLLLVVVVATGSCASTTPIASETTIQPPPTVRPTTPEPSSGAWNPTATPGEITPESAMRVFLDWADALSSGDTARAWDLMAESSRRSVGSYELFAAWESELAEGWGEWSNATNLSATIERDAAGRAIAHLRATVTREGMTEAAESYVFIVAAPDGVDVSPFEEFGNVADGLEHPDPSVPVPSESGAGRRIVYGNSAQRVWIVETDGSAMDSYLVSGREGVPAPGTYEVFSKDEIAYAGHDGITMRYMVRFTQGANLAIGFHSIPNRANGTPLQSEEQLGEYHSAGCVRQSLGHAAALYEWADIGTTVVVLP